MGLLTQGVGTTITTVKINQVIQRNGTLASNNKVNKMMRSLAMKLFMITTCQLLALPVRQAALVKLVAITSPLAASAVAYISVVVAKTSSLLRPSPYLIWVLHKHYWLWTSSSTWVMSIFVLMKLLLSIEVWYAFYWPKTIGVCWTIGTLCLL